MIRQRRKDRERRDQHMGNQLSINQVVCFYSQAPMIALS